jgi:hypothetical protein
MEIKQIVKEMLAAGMPESEILSNLTDLGIPNAPKVLAEAKAAASQKQAKVEEAPAPKQTLFSEEPEFAAQKPSLFDDKPAPPLAGSVLDSSALGSDAKLEELIALTKSLLELNKKILESNREILLRLSK